MAKKREMAVLRKEETNFDKILAYHINPEEFPLSPKLEEIRKRWSEILTLRIGGFTPAMIVKKWKLDKDIESAQAYIDIRNSETLYGNISKSTKEAKTALWFAWAEDYMMRMRRKGNDKMEGFILKAMRLEDTEDDLEFNIEKFENKDLHIKVAPEVIKKLMEMVSKGSMDLNNLDFTDIPHEELPTDEDL